LDWKCDCTEYTHVDSIDSSASVEHSDINKWYFTNLAINTRLNHSTKEVTNENEETEDIEIID